MSEDSGSKRRPNTRAAPTRMRRQADQVANTSGEPPVAAALSDSGSKGTSNTRAGTTRMRRRASVATDTTDAAPVAALDTDSGSNCAANTMQAKTRMRRRAVEQSNAEDGTPAVAPLSDSGSTATANPPIGPTRARRRPSIAVDAIRHPAAAALSSDSGSSEDTNATTGPTRTRRQPARTDPAPQAASPAVAATPDQHDAEMQLCLELSEHQKLRIHCIVAQSRLNRSIESLLARGLGYHSDIEDAAARKALFKQAADIRRAVEASREPPLPTGDGRAEIIQRYLPLVLINAQSRKLWDDRRELVEDVMRDLADRLPVAAWVRENAKGVGPLGLARIVGEAPLIGVLTTHEKLWKRLGLAVIAGERQQKKSEPEEALLHGYAPRRRAEIWSICSDSLLRQQWRGGEDGTEGFPNGPYGVVYRDRKAATLPRIAATDHLPFSDRAKWTAKRCDNDARRVMSKEFLRDLWRVWHGLEARHTARWTAAQAA